MVEMQAPNKLLVIKLRYVGDVVLSTPVLTRLREGFPKAQITMLVNEGTEGVLMGHPALDHLFVLQRGNFMHQWQLIRKVRAEHFDCVLDLTDADRSAVLSWLAGSPVRLGYNSEQRWRGKLYTQVITADRFGMHTVQYHGAMTDALGLSGPLPAPTISVLPESKDAVAGLLKAAGVDAGQPYVCVHPGARWWFKAWPVERFASLADRIQSETNVQALFIGGAQEREAMNRIVEQMTTPVHHLVERTSLQTLAATLERSVLMISNDNGPMHMAAALRVPVIGLFGPSDPKVWGPWGGGHRVFYKGVDCRVCFHPDCFRGEQNCMRLITLDEVWEVVRQRL